MTTLNAALQQFEATEANLEKLKKIWTQIRALLGNGPAFGGPPEYEELCFKFRRILFVLPSIDGFRVEDQLYDYNSVGQMRLDALEIGEIEAEISVESMVEEQGRLLDEYSFRLQTKRGELVRERALGLIDEIDQLLRTIVPIAKGRELHEPVEPIAELAWSSLKQSVAEINTLLGSSAQPPRWGDLQRHLYFGLISDLLDIQKYDWPAVKEGLRATFYGEHEPIPVDVSDLGEIVAAKPSGPVPTKLDWSVLSDEDFERLVFLIIADTPGYENPEWLQQTHAPDRGRDLSVHKVETDRLAGVRRHRVIIQCKHWLSRSVNASDVAAVRSQMELWQPPRVDNLVIITSGRFTADAVHLIEQHNQSDRALHISMWPENHLERLVAARPHLIAQFGLRRTQ